MTERAKTGGPTAVPFLELMRRVPVTYRAEWESHFAEDGSAIGHSYAPAGKMLHESSGDSQRAAIRPTFQVSRSLTRGS